MPGLFRRMKEDEDDEMEVVLREGLLSPFLRSTIYILSVTYHKISSLYVLSQNKTRCCVAISNITITTVPIPTMLGYY